MAEERRSAGASGGAPTLGELLEEAMAAVAQARAALAAGEVPDLEATASLVDRALAALGEATAEQLPSARLKLLGLLDEVSALVVGATGMRDRLGGQLADLGTRRQAIAAYAGNRGRG